MSKRQKRRRGDIFQIDLGNGYFGFGQVLEDPLSVFFNLRASKTPPIEQILESDVAFSLWVMEYAVTDGDWPIIGSADVSEAINELPPFFKQDPISDALSITYTGDDEKPATLESVAELECAAVWDPEHVVDRLNDHFAGRPNAWVESMRPTEKLSG